MEAASDCITTSTERHFAYTRNLFLLHEIPLKRYLLLGVGRIDPKDHKGRDIEHATGEASINITCIHT